MDTPATSVKRRRRRDGTKRVAMTLRVTGEIASVIQDVALLRGITVAQAAEDMLANGVARNVNDVLKAARPLGPIKDVPGRVHHPELHDEEG